MKLMILAVSGVALAACVPSAKQSSATSDRPSAAESEAYMRKAEEQWAMLGVTKDRALLPRILAEDYTGVGTRGTIRNKAETIQNELEDASAKGFVSVKQDEVKYTHFGDTVVAQGRETFTRSGGQPDYHIAWSDVWMWRDGQWQVVASHASVPVEAKPASSVPVAGAAATDAMTMEPAQNGSSE